MSEDAQETSVPPPIPERQLSESKAITAGEPISKRRHGTRFGSFFYANQPNDGMEIVVEKSDGTTKQNNNVSEFFYDDDTLIVIIDAPQRGDYMRDVREFEHGTVIQAKQ